MLICLFWAEYWRYISYVISFRDSHSTTTTTPTFRVTCILIMTFYSPFIQSINRRLTFALNCSRKGLRKCLKADLERMKLSWLAWGGHWKPKVLEEDVEPVGFFKIIYVSGSAFQAILKPIFPYSIGTVSESGTARLRGCKSGTEPLDTDTRPQASLMTNVSVSGSLLFHLNNKRRLHVHCLIAFIPANWSQIRIILSIHQAIHPPPAKLHIK